MLADSRENRLTGIMWMLATMFCFISLDAMMKHLLETYSLVEVTWGRFFFATVVAFILCGKRLPSLVVSATPKLQLLRSVLLMSTTGAFNAGIRSTPLPTATTIMFMSPLLVTVLSVPFLKEHVGPRRWLGVGIGFIGALIVVRPWEGESGAAGSAILILPFAALLNASYQITTRKVRADDPLTSLLYTATAGAIVTSCMAPWFWSWPSAFGWMQLVGTGIAGGIGHFCLIKAMSAAPASVVAPFTYSSLVWATLFGLIFWHYWPDPWTWAGALLIVGSGLYIFHREQVQHENS